MKRPHNQITRYGQFKGPSAKNEAQKRLRRGGIEGFGSAAGKRAPKDQGGLANLAPLLAQSFASGAKSTGISKDESMSAPKDQNDSQLKLESTNQDI